MKKAMTQYLHRYSIECECGSPYHRASLDIWHFEDEPDDNLFELTFIVFGDTLLDRFKAAWRVLRGEYIYHDVCLDIEGIEKLGEAVAEAKRIYTEMPDAFKS